MYVLGGQGLDAWLASSLVTYAFSIPEVAHLKWMKALGSRPKVCCSGPCPPVNTHGALLSVPTVPAIDCRRSRVLGEEMPCLALS